MNQPTPSREQRLEEILAAYLQAVDAGQAPDRDELLARHPDLAGELSIFLSNQGHVQAHAVPYHGVTLPPGTTEPAPGMTVRYIGDYELLEELARGGMGVVFRARQVSLNRIIALKMILAGALASPADVKRFQAEAEAAANLDHPNILPIYEVGEHEGQPYFSMKLVEGASLAQKVPELLHVPRAAAELMARVARAVHFAHQRGILHRDLKPANILLSFSRDAESSERSAMRVAERALRSEDFASRLNGLVPYVTDFGLAKRVEGDAGLTQSGTILGTPSYMAPEQARAEKKLTTQADVWSLGAILYELLTGRPPFRSATVVDTVLQVLEREPDQPRKLNPHVDPDLAVIALKCLEKEPAKRYESASALADDLERWLRGEPIVARSAGSVERVWKWARRRPAVAALLAIVVITLMAHSLTSTFFAIKIQERRNEAEALAKKEAEARGLADDLRIQEAEQRKRAERALYRNSIALAHSAWQGNEVRRAKHALEDCPPKDRGWEWRFLRRLCESGMLTLGADRGGFTSVAFSPDSKRLAGGSGNDVVIWELPSGREVQVLHGTPGRGEMLKIAFSPDGKALAAGRGAQAHITAGGQARSGAPSELVVWDLATGKPRFSRLGESAIFDLVFLPSGKQLVASYSPFGAVIVRDAFTGREITSLKDAGEYLVLGRDGKRLACGNIFKTNFWNTATWMKDGEEPFGGIHAFGPGSVETQLAAVDSMSGAVRIWDLSKHQVVQSYNAHAGPVVSLAFVHSRLITGGLYGRVRVWSDSGRLLRTFRGHSTAVWGLAVTDAPGPFGLGALATAGGEIKVWNYEDDQEGQSLDGQNGWVPPQLSPSGRMRTFQTLPTTISQRCAARAWQGEIPLALLRSEKDDGPAVVWNEQENKATCQMEVPVTTLSPIAFRPDVKLCAIFGKDAPKAKDSPGTLSVSDTTTGRKLWSVRLNRPASWLALSPRGEQLTAGEVHPHEVHRPIGYKVNTVHPKSQVFRAYDVHTGNVLWSRHDPVWDSEFTGDGRLLLTTGGENGPTHLRCVDATTGNDLWELPLEGEIRAQTTSLDGSLLALAQAKGAGAPEIEILDLRTGKPLSLLKGEVFSGFLYRGALAFTPDGQRLAVGRPDGSIRLWDPRSSIELLTLRGHQNPVYQVTFTPDGNALVSVAADDSARLWNATALPDRR